MCGKPVCCLKILSGTGDRPRLMKSIIGDTFPGTANNLVSLLYLFPPGIFLPVIDLLKADILLSR